MGWERKAVEVAVAQVRGYLYPSPEEQAAAYELLVEFSTRTITAPLSAADGTIREALTSIYAMFGITREVLRKHGAPAAKGSGGNLSLALVATRVLNEVFRPVTSRWHPELVAWEAKRELQTPVPDPIDWERRWVGAEACRADLIALRSTTRAYTDTLARICGRPDLADAAQVIPPSTVLPAKAVADTVRSAAASATVTHHRSPMVGWVGAKNGIACWWARRKGLKSGQAAQYPAIADISPDVDFSNRAGDAFTFDYVADLGDGFDATMAVAWALGRRQLSLPHDSNGELPSPPMDLPRGELLILGGDEVYPYASIERYRSQTALPYQLGWETHPSANATPADASSGEPEAIVVAVPGNHDWMGGIEAFDSFFVKSADGADATFADHWKVAQRRRFWHVKLPHNWWVWGIDTGLKNVLPDEQISYFSAVAERTLKDRPGQRVIVCTPVPVSQLSQKHPVEYRAIRTALERVVQSHGARIPLWISGDSHYFAHYQGLGTAAAEHHVTAGGGGAFLQPTHQLPERLPFERGAPEFRLTARWPSPTDSRALAARPKPIRDPQYRGALGIGALIHLLFASLIALNGGRIAGIADRGTNRVTRALFTPLSSWPAWVVLAVVLAAALFATSANSREARIRSAGKLHGLIIVGGGLATSLLVVNVGLRLVQERPTSLGVWLAALVGGWLSTIVFFRTIVWVNSRIKAGDTMAFSPAGSPRYKHFVRMRIDTHGDLSCYVIGLDPVGERWLDALSTPGGTVPPWDSAGAPRLHYVWGTVMPKFDPPPMRVTISISDGEGTLPGALEPVFDEVCGALIDRGHVLLYGGLPRFGFTARLADEVQQRQGDPAVGRHVQNHVAAFLDNATARAQTRATGMQYVVAPRLVVKTSSREQEVFDLVDLRRGLTDESHVRLVIGGRRLPVDYSGTAALNRRAPGVLEEAYLSLFDRKPLLVAGGFGGCGELIVSLLRREEDTALLDEIAAAYTAPDGLAGVRAMADAFRQIPLAPNGLSPAENRELWSTTDPTVVAALVVRAVERLSQRGPT